MGVTVHTDGGRIDFSADDIDACGFIPGKKTYSWTGGEMEADMCIVCTGATQASSLYADSGLEAWLNEKGQVKVGVSLGCAIFGWCWGGVEGKFPPGRVFLALFFSSTRQVYIHLYVCLAA